LRLDVAVTPARAKTWPDRVWIVVDVLRASSTLVTLLESGAGRVYPVKTVAQARRLARQEKGILAGERNGIPPSGFDFGNSPTSLSRADLSGRSVVLSTSNGTMVLDLLKESPKVMVGCFLNARACCQAAVEEALRLQVGVGIACAGVRGDFALDDTVCVGYLAVEIERELLARGISPVLNDAARAAGQLYRSYPDIMSAFLQSASGRRVIEIGDEPDNEFCSRIDVSKKVPVLVPGPVLQLAAWQSAA